MKWIILILILIIIYLIFKGRPKPPRKFPHNPNATRPGQGAGMNIPTPIINP